MTTHQPQVGDVITTAEELDALPQGVIVMDARGEGWQRFTEPNDEPPPPLPITVLYLPGTPPRPERVVKAGALREAASDWESLVQREAPPVRGSVWLAKRADRIEATR